MPWMARLRTASTQEETLDVVRDFVASMSDSDIAALPESCRPDGIATAEQLQALASRLVGQHRHGDDARLVHKLSEFFSSAAVRFAELPPRKME